MFILKLVKNTQSILFTPQQQNQAIETNRLTTQIVRTASTSMPTTAGADEHWKNHPHAKHWKNERILSIVLLASIPASVIMENPITDYLLGATLILHGYWGLHTIFTDYIKGVNLPKIAMGSLRMLAIIGFLGLCYFNYYDMGLGKAIKRVWAL